MTATLSIIIVGWNSGSYLRECLTSIPQALSELAAICELERVIVVDNGSTDGSADGLSLEHTPLQVIRNTTNRGFAAACNQGAAETRSDFLLFLNPDTQLFAKSLSVPVAHLLAPENKRTGIVGIQLIDDSGAVSRSCSRFPRAHHFVSHALGLDRRIPRLHQAMIDWDHLDSRVVDQVIGAFFMVRREPFVSLGGFDERFFVYYEEVDFSLRAKQAGWRSEYLSDAQAYHRGCGTTDQIKGRRLFYSLRSRLLYGAKHYRAPELVGLYFATGLLEPVGRLAALTLSGRLAEAAHLYEGFALLCRSAMSAQSDTSSR